MKTLHTILYCFIIILFVVVFNYILNSKTTRLEHYIEEVGAYSDCTIDSYFGDPNWLLNPSPQETEDINKLDNLLDLLSDDIANKDEITNEMYIKREVLKSLHQELRQDAYKRLRNSNTNDESLSSISTNNTCTFEKLANLFDIQGKNCKVNGKTVELLKPTTANNIAINGTCFVQLPDPSQPGFDIDAVMTKMLSLLTIVGGQINKTKLDEIDKLNKEIDSMIAQFKPMQDRTDQNNAISAQEQQKLNNNNNTVNNLTYSTNVTIPSQINALNQQMFAELKKVGFYSNVGRSGKVDYAEVLPPSSTYNTKWNSWRPSDARFANKKSFVIRKDADGNTHVTVRIKPTFNINYAITFEDSVMDLEKYFTPGFEIFEILVIPKEIPSKPRHVPVNPLPYFFQLRLDKMSNGQYLCMDDGGGSAPKQTKFHNWTCDAKNYNQVFKYDPINQQIRSAHPNKSTLCLDDDGASYNSKQKLTLNTCDATNRNQKFVYDANAKSLQNATKFNLCVDDGGGMWSGATKYTLWNCLRNRNQQFVYERVSA